MKAEIIAVGTELLLGDILNTNAQFLSQELAAMGFDVYYQSVVGDNERRLAAAIGQAKGRSELVVLCGGLGPTKDDLTRETAAAVYGIALVHDDRAQENINEYFMARHMRMAESNNRQAMVFDGGTVLYNDNGTAPGLFYSAGGSALLVLPGPPRELQPMFTEKAAPVLAALAGGTIRSRTLRVFGICESELEQRLSTLIDNPNPTVALYAKTGEVHIRVTAKADCAEKADAEVEKMIKAVAPSVGDCVYSDSGRSLAETVVELLKNQGKRISSAESMTGGMLAAALTDVPGASSVFEYGFVTYSEGAKSALVGVKPETLERFTAVSADTAAEMAQGARRASCADIGVSVTGYAGPTGDVGRAFIAADCAGRTAVKELSLGDRRTREYVREVAVKNALDLVRRILLGLPHGGTEV